jgi:hypothetical protein
MTSQANPQVARRRDHERQVADMAASGSWEFLAWNELWKALHEEVHRLPEECRIPLVLCYLEGRSQAEAARYLHWPIGTVKSRLARACDLLRDRLGPRHPAILAAPCIAEVPRDLTVPEALARSTVEAAMRLHRARRSRGVPG